MKNSGLTAVGFVEERRTSSTQQQQQQSNSINHHSPITINNQKPSIGAPKAQKEKECFFSNSSP
jgi:hypothetical protein